MSSDMFDVSSPTFPEGQVVVVYSQFHRCFSGQIETNIRCIITFKYATELHDIFVLHDIYIVLHEFT